MSYLNNALAEQNISSEIGRMGDTATSKLTAYTNRVNTIKGDHAEKMRELMENGLSIEGAVGGVKLGQHIISKMGEKLADKVGYNVGEKLDEGGTKLLTNPLRKAADTLRQSAKSRLSKSVPEDNVEMKEWDGGEFKTPDEDFGADVGADVGEGGADVVAEGGADVGGAVAKSAGSAVAKAVFKPTPAEGGGEEIKNPMAQENVEAKIQEEAPAEGGAEEGAEVGGEEALETMGTSVAENVGADVVEGSAEFGLAAGLEAVGTALDTTGIGAVVGVGLNLAGLAVAGYGAYESGKSAVDWFQEHVLHTGGPKIPPNIKSLTMAQKGGIVSVVNDAVSNTPASVGGW